MVDLQKCGNTQRRNTECGNTQGRLAGEGLIILIVDDDPDMRAYVRHCLSYLGNRVAQVIEAKDGLEAMQYAQRVLPDLVVSDIVMPGLDGYELCKALKAHADLANTSILLISGENDDERLREAEADAFLGKPFNAERLRKSLDRVLGKHIKKPDKA